MRRPPGRTVMDAMNFDELEQMLLAPAPGERVAAQARRLLEGVVSGRYPLRAVRHPLGFLCLPALREPDRGVCIHLFDTADTTAPRVDPYHSHSWDLLSHVLYGVVTDEPVEVVDDHERPTHRIYEVISDPSGVDVIQPTLRCVRGRAGAVRTVLQGETYTLPAGRFHASTAPRGPAATLVLGRTRPGGHDFSLGSLDGGPRRTVRMHCDARETALSAGWAVRRMHADS